MKQLTLAFGLALLGAACTPLGLYYKQGVTVQASEDAETLCKVAAARDIPVRNVTKIIPGRQLPPTKVCDSAGNCQIRPGEFIPPEFITSDANEELRAKAVDLCMRSKGYEYVRLPACKAEVTKSLPEGQTVRLPKLTSTSCVARSSGGRWQIVTPN